MGHTPFSVSIIIEWYNVTRAGSLRGNQAMHEIVQQVNCVLESTSYLNPPVELIVTFDSSKLSYSEVSSSIRDILLDEVAINLIILPVDDGTYCVQKNRGAESSTGDILIFVDSDVIPQHGWLVAMTGTFQDAAIDVVVGNTFVDCADNRIYSKAFALTWMFPRRCEATGIKLATDFYANNFAVRRKIFLEHPFQDVPRFIHAAARKFVSELRRNEIPIWAVPRAKASHPPPNGFNHYVLRALATGRYRGLYADLSEGVLMRILKDFGLVAYNCKFILFNRQSVSLRLLQTPAAMVISASYDLLVMAGFVLSKCFPKWMLKRFDL